MKIFTTIFFCLTFVMGISAQSSDGEILARNYLSEHTVAWGLSQDDIGQLRLSAVTTSSKSNLKHYYFIQQFRGVDVYNKIYNASIRHGRVVHAAHRLEPALQEKIGNTARRISAAEAVEKAFADQGVILTRSALRAVESNPDKVVFEKTSASLSEIPVRLIYMPDANGVYQLSWVAEFDLVEGHDLWNVSVNAKTGEIVHKVSLTTHCSFHDSYLKQDWTCEEHAEESLAGSATAMFSGDQYKVIKFPNESPIHGVPEFVIDPADPEASPFGWHDIDGVEGAEFTYTEGNNVRAFIDRDNDNIADTVVADGGADLHFDFPFDPELEPVDYQRAAVTNMFYAMNYLHDFTYHYGFDEESGNFQRMNYTGLGVEDDFVIARNQVGAGLANPPLNNASFGTPSDGGNGRMQMYVWESGANELLTVVEPEEIAGRIETATVSSTAPWGGAITNEPLTGTVAIVDDGTGQGTLGCNPLQNGAEIAGKIALVDRGVCEFGTKALRAQNAGAIGVIICNFEEGLVTMGGGSDGGQVNIPVLFIRNSDCQTIRAFVDDGLVVSFVDNSANQTGPARRDGGFDNGVIAHEFAHGISNRLTGGPGMSGCLTNYDTNGDDINEGEQMGEGWSDYFTLVTTVRPGDTRFTRRGIGTYADKQEVNGIGIRRYAYNTDMSENPLTYDDIAFESVPHGIGAVWASMLWDLYWDLVDEYGFDEDLIHGVGGNNIALQLVMDGMKMQPCNPGFVDARNAILAADLANNAGANQEIIWKAFARRGLGWSAIQGNEASQHDNREAFDLPPFLGKDLFVRKRSTPDVNPGETYSVEVMVVNYSDADATAVVLSDVIPDGTELIGGSVNLPFEISGNMIIANPGTIAQGDTVVLTYDLVADNLTVSDRLFFDDFEEGSFNWVNFIDEGSVIWTWQDIYTHSGSGAMFFENPASATDGGLVNIEAIEVTVENPVLRFYHTYETEAFFDAGIVMISTDDGVTYYPLENDNFFRGHYTGKVSYSQFAILNQRGFYGKSNDWVASYIDLGDYIGETVRLKFRFSSDDNTSALGWGIDDVEVLDAKYYNSETCVTSAEFGSKCVEAEQRGTFINYDEVVSVDNPKPETFDISVFPNPNSGTFFLEVSSEVSQVFAFTLRSLEGKVIWSGNDRILGTQRIQVDAPDVPQGFFILEARGEFDQTVQKIFIR